MPTELMPSIAEQRAETATQLPAFNRLNLRSIRIDVAEILQTIGQASIFRQYTKHDMSHIDAMLMSLDWLIPKETQLLMTAADWLMTVMSIYFHDMGLVVTQAEFDARNQSNFPDYRRAVNEGDRGEEYKNKVQAMGVDESERFLYQEFVRENHAHRIKLWITGSSYLSVGASHQLASEVGSLLQNLDDRFKRDLALVCDSHHQDDLNDFTKYKTSQPYGGLAAEVVNVHYAALILRTGDLLHVTRDRTPSIAFRLINPTDPKSIAEWQKQMAIVAVQAVAAKNKDGDVMPDLQSETVGFYALFKQPDGYFALTSYLSYVRTQLRLTSEWADIAIRKQGSKFRFPWRNTDESGIEAEGFLKKQFEFTLDQARILDLLTGHTLYNDANVVIRELVQNGIDAVRLDAYERSSRIDGNVTINWNGNTSTLTIEDNGTGMSQDIVERHFLKAGSSRYQDAEFKKSHAGFSSISRFGIGVLSTFMISDEVEVFTVSRNAEEKARKLTLRSLHGKYLIKEYERDSLEVPSGIKDHGTQVTLKLRAGTSIQDVLASARRWVLFPPCAVTVAKDGAAPVSVGFKSPSEAVEYTLRDLGISTAVDPATGQASFSVREMHKDGVTLAFAVKWSEWFKEWEFLSINHMARFENRSDRDIAGIGTCVEGIRIDDVTPGYDGIHLVAVANASGVGSPKTNVARSGFEATEERTAMLDKVYSMYCEHVANEVNRMCIGSAYSPTWAVSEASFLASPLFNAGERVDAINTAMLENRIQEVPSLLVEHGQTRKIMSVSQINLLPQFWTIDSLSIRSIEALFKELPQDLSFGALSSLLKGSVVQIPSEHILAGLKESSAFLDLVFRPREIDIVNVREADRRIDLRWRNKQSKPIWKDTKTSNPRLKEYLSVRLQEMRRFTRPTPDVFIQVSDDLQASGLDSYLGFKHDRAIYLMRGRPFSKALLAIVERAENDEIPMEAVIMALNILNELILRRGRIDDPSEFVDRLILSERSSTYRTINFDNSVNSDEFLRAISEQEWRLFDARAWTRGSGNMLEAFL